MFLWHSRRLHATKTISQNDRRPVLLRSVPPSRPRVLSRRGVPEVYAARRSQLQTRGRSMRVSRSTSIAPVVASILAAVALPCIQALAQSADDEAFYRNKAITMVIGFDV